MAWIEKYNKMLSEYYPTHQDIPRLIIGSADNEIENLQAEVERLELWQRLARGVMMFSEQQEVDRTMNLKAKAEGENA